MDRVPETVDIAAALPALSRLPLDEAERAAFVAAYPDLQRLLGRLRSAGRDPRFEPVGLWRPADQPVPDNIP